MGLLVVIGLLVTVAVGLLIYTNRKSSQQENDNSTRTAMKGYFTQTALPQPPVEQKKEAADVIPPLPTTMKSSTLTVPRVAAVPSVPTKPPPPSQPQSQPSAIRQRRPKLTNNEDDDTLSIEMPDSSN